jgi:hypothetical protein
MPVLFQAAAISSWLGSVPLRGDQAVTSEGTAQVRRSISKPVTGKETPHRPGLISAVKMWLVPVVAAGFLTGPALGSGVAQAAPCENGNGYYRWYATAQSGAGTNQGTGAYMQTWSSWSLDGHPASDGPFSDEAVWTYDENSQDDALEVGFSTGYAGGTGTLSNNMYPYFTVNDDQDPPADETDFTGTSLPTDTLIWNSATSNGSSSWAYINDTLYGDLANYGVATPRVNYEQAEVNYQDIWMGGGSGSEILLYYQTPSNAWDSWGFEDTGTDWYNTVNENTSSPAGHGYYADANPPDIVTEGGYGQTC